MTTSLEWPQTSSNRPRRQLIIANRISMINSYRGRTRSWKTFRQCAFHTYHRVKPAINIQISRNQGDAIFKHLSSRVLTILPLSTLKAFVQLSTERSIQATVFYDVIPSTSHVVRRRVTLSHTLWVWGQSHKQCHRVSICEEQSGQAIRPPCLPSHSTTRTMLWLICHQNSFIFSCMWRRTCMIH